MNKTTFFLLLLLVAGALVVPSQSYAWLQTYEVMPSRDYGFFWGLWHGMIAPLAVFAHIFDRDIILYSSTNNGWYNLGFLIGISCSIGGGSKKMSKEKKHIVIETTVEKKTKKAKK